MDVFYAEQNEQKGPISPEELHLRIQSGELKKDTLVFTEGMTDWLAFSAAAEQGFLPGLPTMSTGGLTLPTRPEDAVESAAEGLIACPTCGKRVAPGDLIPFENRQVCPHCKDRVLQQVKEGVGIATPNTLQYAGFGPRLGSYVIDYILMQVYSQVLSFAMGFTGATLESDNPSPGMIIGFVIYMLLIFVGPYFYYVYMMGSPKHQATLGMKALKLKVVRSDGSQITKWRAFGRQMATIVSGMLLGFGYLMMLWDDEKATLHDKMADTRIVFK